MPTISLILTYDIRPLSDERDWPRVAAEYCHEPRFWAGALGACSRAADAIVVRMNGRPPERMVRMWERYVQKKRKNRPTAAVAAAEGAGGLFSGQVDGEDDDECA